MIFSENRFPSPMVPISDQVEDKLFGIKRWRGSLRLPGPEETDGPNEDRARLHVQDPAQAADLEADDL
jgi:hypothetical protein